MMRIRALGSLFALLTASCSSGGSGVGAAATDPVPDYEDFSAPALNPDRGEAIPRVRFKATPEDNWQRAEKEFDRRNHLAAQQYYSFIRTKFPYSRYAVLSELRIADCQYERDHYLEAIDSYQNFVRLHPTHRQVPYAMFRTGVAHYEQIPGGFFLLPPAEEKDQTAVKQASKALAAYLERFPDHERSDDARKVYREVREKLMAHERYAANFYRKLGRDRAYVGRLEIIREDFSDVGLDPKLLLEIATVHARLGNVDETREAFEEMAEKYPDASELTRRTELVTEAEGTAAVIEEAEKDRPFY
ncbi:MAG: outer membrane protein assembly factor BamD [Myxococcota bacterium]